MWIVKLNELEDFAAQFWPVAGKEKIFLFYGDMGAGKTTMIEAICAAKGVRERMSSPTFSIINEYRFTDKKNAGSIFHIDLYRLESEAEIERAGIEDCLYSGEICMIEWPQKAPSILAIPALHVHIKVIDDETREVTVANATGSMK